MEYITIVADFVAKYLPVAVSVVGSFAMIASLTPNKVDDKIGQVLLDVINFMGANFGKAKNVE